MKLVIAAILAISAAAFAPTSNHVTRANVALNENMADLETLGKKLNPVIGFYDPLQLSGYNFWDTPEDATIGFLRESEIKHGRIAMFAFVGYIVHANGVTWPWPMDLEGTPFPVVSNAPEAWDQIPDVAKLQIIAFVGFLEFWRECNCDKHYMLGGKPGDFPNFNSKSIPGGSLNLYDPFGIANKQTEGKKATGLIKEINNGRLAMLGIMAFVSEGKVGGAVPLLKGIIPHYDGDVMAPLAHSIIPSLPGL